MSFFVCLFQFTTHALAVTKITYSNDSVCNVAANFNQSGLNFFTDADACSCPCPLQSLVSIVSRCAQTDPGPVAKVYVITVSTIKTADPGDHHCCFV